MQQLISNLALFALVGGGEPVEGGAEAPAAQPIAPLYFMIAMTMLLFWFLVIGPERKRAKKKQQLIDSLKKNDRVLTIGGIYGIVYNVKPGDDELVIKIDEDKDVKIRVSKSSIAQVLSAREEKE